jgi:formylglycine-generating enzyme required for sulfatase activity
MARESYEGAAYARRVSGACCVPGDERHGDRSPAALDTVPTGEGTHPDTLVELPAATFRMGDDSVWAYPGDGEGPVHDVALDAFRIDRYAVTNDAFVRFVEATGWQTDAERFGWSFVFAGLLPPDFPDTRGVVGAEWWRQVPGADWRHPEGPGSDLADRGDHPVVHVSWHDATAYCRWTATRLPTEAEWERAARGDRVGAAFPWGDDLEPGGEHRMNVFQGRFPDHDDGADGFVGTAPVGAFPPNDFGLHNVTGNVWEWCADWFDVHAYERCESHDPGGPGSGEYRVQRGGSYLCHISYCGRYRVSARYRSEPSSSTGNAGFRVAADAS